MDDKVVVFRTHIEIHDYHKWDYPPIEKTFSAPAAIYNGKFIKWEDKGMYLDTNTNTLYLPRGIDVFDLEGIFNCRAVYDQSVDPYEDIGTIMLRYKPRDEVQEEALKFMLARDKYFNNQNHTMLSLNLNTGKGKTYCAIATMAFLRMRSIVIASSGDWLEQWKGFFLEYTSIQESEIYLLSGSASMMKLFNRDISKYKVILCTHSSIRSIANTHGWNKVSEFFKYMKIGIKFFDEAHLDFDNMFMIDCFTNTFITYYLTASPGRSDQAENKIYGLYFKNVPKIDLYNRDRDAHTSYIAIKYNSRPTAQEISHCKGKYGLDRNKYTDYLVHKPNFEYLLNILIHRAIHKLGTSLFYIGTNKSICDVRDWIYDHYPELVGNVGIYTSITKDKRAQLSKMIILTTTKSAGAAVDIEDLVDTINLAEPFKSKILTQQAFGRPRHENTTYTDTVDTAFYYTRKFYDARKPVFLKYATDCKEINLTDQDLIERSRKIDEERANLIFPLDLVDDRQPYIDPLE